MIVPLNVDTPSLETQTLRSPKELVKFIYDDGNPKYTDAIHNLAAVTHRQNLVKLWNIPVGARVLELGCGHGEFTVAAADAVGPSGRVVGVDPGPPDYGTPPLGEAHRHVKASPVGPQIDFVRATGAEYLASMTEKFDYVVLVHAAWYFADPTKLAEIARLAASRCQVRVFLVAEFALAASSAAAVPSVLAALATNALESFRGPDSWRNVRCALSPELMRKEIESNGWALRDEHTVFTVAGDRSSWRETMMVVKGSQWVNDVAALQVSDKAKDMLFSMRDALVASVGKLDGGLDHIGNMDVWASSFDLACTGNQS